MEGKKLRKPRISKTCIQCQQAFTGTEAAIRTRVYCSAPCRNTHRKTVLKGEAHWAFKRVEDSCAYCGKAIFIQPARAKSRVDQYCSPECGREGQKKKLRATLKPATNWRTLAKRVYGTACAICGFPHFIEVHHIVHRSKGGSDEISNLVPLCPNHHGMAHANLIQAKDLRKAQQAAESRQGSLAVTVWDQPHKDLRTAR